MATRSKGFVYPRGYPAARTLVYGGRVTRASLSLYLSLINQRQLNNIPAPVVPLPGGAFGSGVWVDLATWVDTDVWADAPPNPD